MAGSAPLLPVLGAGVTDTAAPRLARPRSGTARLWPQRIMVGRCALGAPLGSNGQDVHLGARGPTGEFA
jgi:hypothetical protein